MKIEIWSDVVCPWCYIGKRRLEAALDEVEDVEIVWRSFELHPGAPQTVEGSLDELLAQKYGVGLDRARGMLDTMTENGAAEGIDFRFDIARSGNTLDAHRLLHLASVHERQGAMKERLMQAYFTQGRCISNHEELAEIAVEVLDLNTAEILEFLDGDDFVEEVRADETMARQMGVTGVPFFVFDERFAVPGAQSAETLRLVMQQVREKLEAETAEGQACDAESCEV